MTPGAENTSEEGRKQKEISSFFHTHVHIIIVLFVVENKKFVNNS